MSAKIRPPPWFQRFVHKLLEGEPEVLDLLEHNPFPDAPPRHVRVTRWVYTFTDRATRSADGTLWHREHPQAYLPPVSIRPVPGR